MVTTARRYTSADLEAMPDVEGVRYEVIGGELHVSKQPHWHHQYVCNRLSSALDAWCDATAAGVVLFAPALIFSPENDVAPDLVWISRKRLARGTDAAGHLNVAPELVIEVLSYGSRNERRDRELKLGLYSREDVREYWIVDWRSRVVEIYRRGAGGELSLDTRLRSDDRLTSPLLPGFACPLSRLRQPGLGA